MLCVSPLHVFLFLFFGFFPLFLPIWRPIIPNPSVQPQGEGSPHSALTPGVHRLGSHASSDTHVQCLKSRYSRRFRLISRATSLIRTHPQEQLANCRSYAPAISESGERRIRSSSPEVSLSGYKPKTLTTTPPRPQAVQFYLGSLLG